MSFKQKIVIAVLLAIIFVSGYLVFVYQSAQQGSIAQNIGRKIEKKIQVLAIAAPVYFMPRFPDRLTYLASEMALASQELEHLGGEFNQQIDRCGCRNLVSECFDCRPGSLIGSPCPNQREVEGKRFEVETKLAQISFLRRLLQTELDLSLERELKTLRQDVADDLRNNINVLLQQSQDAIEQGQNAWELSNNPGLAQCQAQCGRQTEGFSFVACINPRQQKTTDVKLSFGFSLNDLNLGEAAIRNVNLSLPETIQTPRLPELDPLIISLPSQTIDFPDTPLGQVIDISRRNVVFHPPGVSVPRVPDLQFSCAQLPNMSSSYQWPQEQVEQPLSILEQEFEEFSQRFGELNAMCLRVLSYSSQGEDDLNYISSPEYENCHTPGKVRETIINMCSTLQTPPPDCASIPPPFDGEIPEAQFAASGGVKTASGQTIANFPKSMPECQASPPSSPKITFPKLIIPDIKLPHWKLNPFFDIRLPSLIFEDLVLPDLELCDLNDCSYALPELRIRSPILDIPPVLAPTIPLARFCTFVQGAGQVCVEMPDVEMTSFNFPAIFLTSFQKFALGNLLTPEIDLPSIGMPKPQVDFSFSGIKFDFANMLLGLLQSFFDLPSGCIAAGIKYIPIKIIYDDFVFNWPVFPEIPQVPFCREVNQFCQDIKEKLGDVTSRVQEMESVVNNILQNQIQERLDQAAQNISQQINQAVYEQLQSRAEKISQEAQKHIQEKAKVVGDLLQVPPLTVLLDPIIIPKISLQEQANLPAVLQIPWPERLKRIVLTKAIKYALPSIPLSNLSYQKDFEIKLLGFQAPSLTVDFGAIRGACRAGTPSGGNPFPVSQIQSAVNGIGQAKNSIEQTSQNIIDILR